MKYSYVPSGVCITNITFNIDEQAIVTDIHFENGCDGNLKVLAKILSGKTVAEIIKIGRNNTCDRNPTSCMDQFANAVEEAAKEYKIDY